MADTAGAEDQTPPQLRLLAQYAKDISFENPQAPDSLRQNLPTPSVDVGIDVKAGRVGETLYEVQIRLTSTASREEKPVFIGELTYAGVFEITNVPEASLQPFLLIECPRLLFPFARRILADLTRDGGFPALNLEPIDFAALFRRQQEGGAVSAGAPSDTAHLAIFLVVWARP
ncbi:MAG: protein-export chaperone SecB [Maricaulaceae bacterium]